MKCCFIPSDDRIQCFCPLIESERLGKTSVNIGYRKVGRNGVDYALVTKYSPCRDLAIRAKVNSSSQVAVAATHSLSTKDGTNDGMMESA
ncbi:hypothetical protein CRE_13908 [Caenorhabditis remanei]|uniref:Uncharacterized protein n=1 Tax=Caenorhabditis remanei TaxID=31234 RepID=E3M8N5_CAERE|nr:hypothetical protein CRE_13908 [Caenorhabditis remanei]